MLDTTVPSFVTPFLWSYDTAQVNIQFHKHLIIYNVLNFGSKRATDWLQSIYSRNEIQEVIRDTYADEWSKKSLALWSLVFEASPVRVSRFI